MSTRYDLTHPQEDAFARDNHTGKEVRLLQKIKGTDYWITEDVTYGFPEYPNAADPYIIVCEYELEDIYHY